MANRRGRPKATRRILDGAAFAITLGRLVNRESADAAALRVEQSHLRDSALRVHRAKYWDAELRALFPLRPGRPRTGG